MNAVHVHLMINHVPIVAAPLTALIIGWGLLRKSREIQRLGLGLAVLVGLATYPVFLSGEAAEERIESASWVVDDQVEAHEGQAKIALIVMLITGVLAAASIWLSRRDRPGLRTMSAVVFASLLLSSTVLTWAALTGGEIRHDEIRPGATATGAADSENDEEHGADDPEEREH